MQSRNDNGRLSLLLVGGLLLLGTAGRSQNSHMPGIPGPITDATTMNPEVSLGAREKLARMQNDERQKRLVNDTEKLLTLATKLHDDVSKTNKNILSLDVVKRADEIEKLAHSVKDRMRG